MFSIEFYRNRNGESPIESFFESLSSKQMQKVAWTLSAIREMSQIPVQYFKKLHGTDDLWEIRVRLANDFIRLICFISDGNIIVLTNGFVKKSQKLPKKEILIAEQRKKEYERNRK